MITVVVPAYNEVSYLEDCVRAVEKFLSNQEIYEIIIAEDGSTDRTDVIASKIASSNDKIFHFHSNERLGKGNAITRAMKAAKGEIILFCDADMAVHPQALRNLISAIDKGYDIAIGSRYIKGSQVSRPIIRWATSLTYNFLVRILFRDGIHDHQCGFKAFRKNVIMNLLKDALSNGWFWDTEILITSLNRGYRITEIPVKWQERKEKGENKKILNSLLYFVSNLLKLKLSTKPRKV